MKTTSRGGTDIVGSTAAQIEAPVAVGMSQNALRPYIRKVGSSKLDGVEVVTYDFHQMLSRVANNTQDPLIFPAGSGYNENVPSLGCAPILFGGLIGKVARVFRRYRWKSLKFSYVPGSPTDAPNQLVFAYDPRSDLSESVNANQNGDGFNFSGFFDACLGLAATAAGPVWGPSAIVVGGLAKKGLGVLGEAALKWFENRKPMSSIDAILEEEDAYRRIQRTAVALFELRDWTDQIRDILIGAGVPGVPTWDPSSGLPNLTNYTTHALYLANALRRMRTAMISENERTIQGMFNGVASSFLPGTGQRNLTGFIMVSGTVELMDPFGDYGNNSTTDQVIPINDYSIYGDPLDLTDPNGFPDHPSVTTGERNAYLFRTWDVTASSLAFSDMIAKTTGHRLHKQRLLGKTTLEVHLNQIILHESLKKRETSIKHIIATNFPKCGVKIEEQSESAAEIDEKDWHQVTSGSPLFKNGQLVQTKDDIMEDKIQKIMDSDDVTPSVLEKLRGLLSANKK